MRSQPDKMNWLGWLILAFVFAWVVILMAAVVTGIWLALENFG